MVRAVNRKIRWTRTAYGARRAAYRVSQASLVHQVPDDQAPWPSRPVAYAVRRSSRPLSFELILENTVLFDELINDRLLLAVKPAGQGDYKEMERLYGDCHYTNRLSLILFDNNIIQFVRIFAPYDIRSHGVPPT